jgi:hypothetical protein
MAKIITLKFFVKFNICQKLTNPKLTTNFRHVDAQGLVLWWGLGLPWSLFMKREVFFGSCYLGNWGCHGVCS